jgi:hypothetical protein
MSFEQSPDHQLIEQTKQQIRALVAEIAQLSKADVAPEEFYGAFLPRVVSALAAVGGAVWALNPEGQLALQYQINLQETKLRESEERQAQHSRLLYKALSSPEGMLVPPHSGPGEADQLDQQTPAANPTDFLLIFGLLRTDLETMGLVEVFQRAEAGPSTQKGYLRFLLQMCELAGDFLKSHQLRHFSHRQTLWTQLEDFTRAVHASLDPRDAAYTIANEGRRLIECDRVSVAIRRGKKCSIEAVSGQDVFDKRSNTVRLLGKLATAVVASGDAVWYTGDTRDLPPQVEDAVQEYVDEAHSKTVAVLPLRRPMPPEEDDPNKRTEPEPPIGALIVEQIEDSRVAASLVQRAEVVGRHSSLALANALEHQSLFLMPVWRTLGKTRWVLQARTLPKTLSIAGGVLLVFLILAVWPARFTLESKGTLEPVLRQNVFAGIDGVVDDIPKGIDHGAMVKKGETLLKLRNTDLGVKITLAEGQRMEKLKRRSAVHEALVEGGRMTREERLQREGEQAELRESLLSLELQLKLYKTEQQELDVRSPINGQVLTWDLRDRLQRRPVQKGQELLRVADPSGPWHLELKMPENRVGHVAAAQQALYDASREKLRDLLRDETRSKLGSAASEEDVEKAVDKALADVLDEKLHDKILALFRQRLGEQLGQILNDVTDAEVRAKLGEVLREPTYEQARAKLQEILPEVTDDELRARLQELPSEELDDQLPVSYILATEPGTKHYGKVTEICRSAEVRGDEGNTVLIKVAIDKSELPDLRPGATVTANVYCGRRPLGYVLLQDVIAFIQSRILFRYF